MPTDLPGISWSSQPRPIGLRLADLEQDGDLDIVSAVDVSSWSYLVTWFNQGNGTFSLGEAIQFLSSSMAFVETADFDLDGDVDVILSTGEYASTYLNDGSGKLAKFGLAYGLSEFGVAVTVADVNRDEFPDFIAVSDEFSNAGELRVFLNHHDGSFGLPPDGSGGTAARPNVVMPMPKFTQSYTPPVAQDLNADGLVDVVVDDARNQRLLYFKADGIASWNSRPTILGAGYYPTQAQASDIDLDGDPDLLAVDQVLGKLVVLENEGGEFSAPVLAPSVFASSLKMADFNNDCFPDAFSANFWTGYVSVMFNRGDGSFAEPIHYSVASFIHGIQAGDVDGDGDVDLVSSGSSTPEGVTPKPGFLSVARNLGTGELWAPRAYDVAEGSGLASGDFDGDGRADFVVAREVLLGASGGGYDSLGSFDDRTSENCGGCGAEVVDLDADGLSDIVRYGVTGAYISNGDGTFDESWALGTSYSSESTSLGHLNKDGLWDFVDQTGNTQNFTFFGATPTTFSEGQYITWTFPSFIGVLMPKLADLNGDGADELLVPNFGSNGLGVGVNNGDGTTFTKKNYALGSRPQGIDVADYTGDGKLDAVVSVEAGSLIVYPGKGDGALLASKTYPMSASPGRMSSADFDGDGDVDLIVSTLDYSNVVMHVENAGNGVFSNAVPLLATVGPTKVVTADLEGDGDPDFAVVSPDTYTLMTFENRQLTEDPAKSQPSVCDFCPKDALKALPGVCGCGVVDADTDDDGVFDCKDACPQDASKKQAGVCGCGVSDRDTDGDGDEDCLEDCPQDPLKIVAGVCGCGVADSDADYDGTADCHDECPSDGDKVAPGTCGCGDSDDDSDDDATADCLDGCPDDPAKTSPGLCGCGAFDGDADLDGTADCSDGCPLDPLKNRAGACGCGMADTDTDTDGWPDCVDACPSTPGSCASSGGESGIGAGGGGDEPSHGGAGGTAGVSPNEPGAAGAGLGGGSEPSRGGHDGDDTPVDAAGSANDSGGAPEQTFPRPTGTQILLKQPASGCDCSMAPSSGASSLGFLPLFLLFLRRRRRGGLSDIDILPSRTVDHCGEQHRL